jgi:hypothetical protein
VGSFLQAFLSKHSMHFLPMHATFPNLVLPNRITQHRVNRGTKYATSYYFVPLREQASIPTRDECYWFTAFRRNFLSASSVQKSKTHLIWSQDDYIITKKTPRPTPSHKLSLDGAVPPTSVRPLFGTQCNPTESSNEFSCPAARVLLLGTRRTPFASRG